MNGWRERRSNTWGHVDFPARDSRFVRSRRAQAGIPSGSALLDHEMPLELDSRK